MVRAPEMRNPLATWLSAHLTGPLDAAYARIDEDLTDDLASAHTGRAASPRTEGRVAAPLPERHARRAHSRLVHH